MTHSPLYGSNVISKFVVTQCKTWLAITPIPTFTLISLENALCVYARGYSVLGKCCSLIIGIIPNNKQGDMRVEEGHNAKDHIKLVIYVDSQ